MSPPRILTFNFHEPYLCLMAKMGIPLTVGLYDEPAFRRPWHAAFRPVPSNIQFLNEPVWRADLSKGRFGVVLAQNEDNASDIAVHVVESKTPALLLLHNRRSYIEAIGRRHTPEAHKNYHKLLERLQQIFAFVFISETKRRDYRLPGRVIPPGIDVEDYGGYRGDTAAILRVGNMMRARDIMFDVDFQEAACKGFPYRVIGEDPQIPEAKASQSFDELLEAYRSHRCLLHVSREAFEDGYNLSTLEAMACGMPVVALGNVTSPIRDGIDGYVSYDLEDVRRRLGELLGDADQARTLGAKGRETIARDFPIDRFCERWRSAFEEAADTSPFHTGQAEAVPRCRILMDYVASPVTTARYLEAALRRRHEVVTAGFRIPEEVLRNWGFPDRAPAYLAQQIDVPLEADAAVIASGLRDDFETQFYFWVDSGLKQLPAGFDLLPGIKICYLIDTHIAADLRIELARHFDFVFLAQKGQLAEFKKRGIASARWLPLACDPDLHRRAEQTRRHDVAYVGRVADDVDDRRRTLLAKLKGRFPNTVVCQTWPEEMARIYAESKIVVNACVNRDVNMRVFEAMASGALLITDDADGLDDLLEEGVHYVRYRSDDEVHALVERYLNDDAARVRIAEAGRAFVMSRHTYEQRMEEMLRIVLADLGAFGGLSGESRFERGGYYRNTRSELLPFVPEDARRVLDCGCGGGEFGRQLKERGGVEVVGIEVVDRAWEIAKENLDQALLGSIESMELPFDDGYFDCLCFNDVLEHLTNPLAALEKASRVLRPGGTVVVSIPNARFYEVVHMLANGRWQYVDAGIMDRTHLRFFTATELAVLLEDAGLEVNVLQPLTIVPESDLPRGPGDVLRFGRVTIDKVSDSEYVEFRTFQWLAVARKPEGSLLERARKALDEQENARAYDLAKRAPESEGRARSLVLAKAAARCGHLAEAERQYRSVLEADPGDIEAAGELGILYLAQNRIDDARPLVEFGAQAENERVLGALGLLRLADEAYSDAVDCFLRALEHNVHQDTLVPSLIEAAREAGRVADISAFMERFLEFFPGKVDIACAYARVLIDSGMTERARDTLETVLLLAPHHEEAANLFAALTGE